MRQDAYGSFGRRLERTPPSWHRCGTDSVPQCGTSQDSMGRWCAGNPYRTGLCATQDDFSISSDSDSNPVGLPKNPRIYEVFCHLERFRLPIGRRALNWHASLCVNGATAEGVQVPRTSEIEGTCCAAPLQRRRHGGRTDCGSSDRCRDPSVVRSSDSRVTPPKNDLRSELARPRTSGPRILTARKHLRRTKGEPSRCRALGLILPSRSLDQQTSPQYSRLLNPSSHWQTDTNI